MAQSAAAAISEAIIGYKNQDSERVLAQFSDGALIVGTREDERWDSRDEVSEALAYELSQVEVDGPLTETGRENEFILTIADHVAVYHRDDSLVFNGREVRGRWSAVLRNEAEDPKSSWRGFLLRLVGLSPKSPADWRIVHSHFSLAEGYTTPNGSEAGA